MVLGASGTGKSSLANSFLGWRRPARSLPFPVISSSAIFKWHLKTFAIKVGHGVVAGTTSSAYASGPWLGLPDRFSLGF